MKRLTYHSSDGRFGIVGKDAPDMREIDKELYACVWKLKDYEDTGFNPDFLQTLPDCCMDLMDNLRKLPESTIRNQAMRIVKHIA